MAQWKVRDRFLDLKTRWFVLIGEHLETEHGEELEYWRIERAHSLIVLPLWRDQVVLPAPMYRPGMGQTMLDFPGGRMATEQNPRAIALQILHRELALTEADIESLEPLNEVGWAINSSFSNQQLFGWVAHLHDGAALPEDSHRFPATGDGIQTLTAQLSCLQCRAVLQTWQLQCWAAK